MRVFLLTTAALIGFASNSLLTRGALATGRLDAATFMGVRLLTGALTLGLLVKLRRAPATERGSWTSAAALAAYAVAFTLAYGRISASVGALVLFGSVQITMIGTGLIRGERPARITGWRRLAIAVAPLVFTVPASTP
jgi:drug/metabolite transporter (DMT)-like permease